MIRKYTLRFDNATEKWILKHDTSEKIVKVFATKEDATRAGVVSSGFLRAVAYLRRKGHSREVRTDEK
jgi:hypothetical protein